MVVSTNVGNMGERTGTEIDTTRKDQNTITAPSKIPFQVAINKTYHMNDTTTAIILIHDTTHEEQNTIKKSPTANTTAVTVPKIPFQIASHLKFASSATARKFKAKAKTKLIAQTKITHNHNTIA